MSQGMCAGFVYEDVCVCWCVCASVIVFLSIPISGGVCAFVIICFPRVFSIQPLTKLNSILLSLQWRQDVKATSLAITSIFMFVH